MNTKQAKPWYKKWWVWLIIILILIGIGGAAGGNNGANSSSTSEMKSNETAQPAKPKWDVEDAYSKVNDGMTKAEVEAAVGKTSDNCSESSMQYVGKTEICTYGSLGDNGSITVTYQNDKVASKAKTKF